MVGWLFKLLAEWSWFVTNAADHIAASRVARVLAVAQWAVGFSLCLQLLEGVSMWSAGLLMLIGVKAFLLVGHYVVMLTFGVFAGALAALMAALAYFIDALEVAWLAGGRGR